MPNATQGRNSGRPRKATTMTSNSVQPAAAPKARPRAAAEEAAPLEAPVLYIEKRPQVDVYDTGLESEQWHYLWVNKLDSMSISGYYGDGYRFVRYEDVKDHFKEDQRLTFLYEEDVNGWVGFGPTDRLMRIPQRVYRERINAALNGQELSPADKARQLLQAQIEEGKYSGEVHKSATVSADEDTGNTEVTTLDQGGTE